MMLKLICFRHLYIEKSHQFGHTFVLHCYLTSVYNNMNEMHHKKCDQDFVPSSGKRRQERRRGVTMPRLFVKEAKREVL